MKKYCFDTSGISNPLEAMPEDIHKTMWRKVTEIIKRGEIAVTKEIHDEMVLIPGNVGSIIRLREDALVLEVNENSWDWRTYLAHSSTMNRVHHQYISEYCGGSKKTVCLNDMSGIALAKTLGLPLVSMEARVGASTTKRRIPDVCSIEGVQHLNFNDFLRREGIAV
jgi:hypothetical protein